MNGDVQHLAALAGLELPAEDVADLEAALAAHAELVRPLLELDLLALPSALDLDVEW